MKLTQPNSKSVQKNQLLPLIGLGTSRLVGHECETIIKMGVELGYRHIDTAPSYGNHLEIGKAIQSLDREPLFVTSKFLPEQGDVKEACELALKELRLDYLDLYLIHWPNRNLPLKPILEGMELLKQSGKIHNWGVSNFTIHHLQDLLDLGFHPAYNQVEFHPYLYQKELLFFCIENKIQLISYRPLGKGALLSEPLLTELSKKYQKTPAQILLKWNLTKNIPVLVKSTSRKHLEENLDLFDFTLETEDVCKMELLHCNKRFCLTEWNDFNY